MPKWCQKVFDMWYQSGVQSGAHNGRQDIFDRARGVQLRGSRLLPRGLLGVDPWLPKLRAKVFSGASVDPPLLTTFWFGLWLRIPLLLHGLRSYKNCLP